ncbi:4a-hydroxytetrahydrobiopterin dehydratase [uncultured Oceanicoccus sp.]|uniref:4a-hydroxytetrahydrobiopterin dehydratase n=1 Tax=uncultured Oceanicoccus sp. TaxID=1706381 RepID=UPI0030DB6DAC
MNEMVALSEAEIEARLKSHTEWVLQDNKLYRRVIFADFVQAFGFMTQVALVAEKINHHPEWSNVYRTVEMYLTTHDAGGISQLDFELLEEIEQLIGTQ